jgi:hypothetical protein
VASIKSHNSSKANCHLLIKQTILSKAYSNMVRDSSLQFVIANKRKRMQKAERQKLQLLVQIYVEHRACDTELLELPSTCSLHNGFSIKSLVHCRISMRKTELTNFASFHLQNKLKNPCLFELLENILVDPNG